MNDLVIALDVGGTNTRARIATVSGTGEPHPVVPDVSARAGSMSELTAIVSDVVRTAESLGTVVAAVVAIAGPVLGERSHVTNWACDSLVQIRDLERAGLPAGRTRLVNDATAGAWGALDRVDRDGPVDRAYVLAARDGSEEGLGGGNLVYVAPGTGLSSAFIVRHGLGPIGASVVACEFENTQMPRFEGEIGLVVDAVAAMLGRAPDWEDLVSGRGLVRIYDALAAIGMDEPPDAAENEVHGAGAIADAAIAGDDPRALAAVEVFYRTLGHFAQTLALTSLPCAAVVIGGASTERNLDLLRGSGLAEVFATHHRFGDLLGAITLYAVGGEVNLEGAVRLGLEGY